MVTGVNAPDTTSDGTADAETSLSTTPAHSGLSLASAPELEALRNLAVSILEGVSLLQTVQVHPSWSADNLASLTAEVASLLRKADDSLYGTFDAVTDEML